MDMWIELTDSLEKSKGNGVSGDFIFEDDRPELVDLENGTIALLTVGGIEQWVKLDWQDWNHISIKGIDTCDVPYDECMEILDERDTNT